MTDENQKARLADSTKTVKGCPPCATYVPVAGFRPQFFSQNEGSDRIPAGLGFTWSNGVKLGKNE